MDLLIKYTDKLEQVRICELSNINTIVAEGYAIKFAGTEVTSKFVIEDDDEQDVIGGIIDTIFEEYVRGKRAFALYYDGTMSSAD